MPLDERTTETSATGACALSGLSRRNALVQVEAEGYRLARVPAWLSRPLSTEQVGLDPIELTVEDVWDTLAVQLSDLTPPGVADSLRALGSATAITVKWAPVDDSDLLGYDIARASAFEGPYGRINAQTVVGTTFFEDGTLPALTRYDYKIAARDSSFNGGADSQIIAATTNPPLHDGWPIETTQSPTCGVKVADLDGVPGPELVTGSDCVYVWHVDGTEVTDGDGPPPTPGSFSPAWRGASGAGRIS